jgi:hypothetical protein
VVCLVVVYVDDCLFVLALAQKAYKTYSFTYGKWNSSNYNTEDKVAGFLGIHMSKHEDGSIDLITQVVLIDRIHKAMGLENGRPKDTPTKYGDLPENKEGDPCNKIGVIQVSWAPC